MLKILIIDDEKAAGNILKILIEKHITVATQIEYCTSAKDALALLKNFTPSLVMLDIEMPGMNGFDFLNLATDNEFDVQISSGKDQSDLKIAYVVDKDKISGDKESGFLQISSALSENVFSGKKMAVSLVDEHMDEIKNLGFTQSQTQQPNDNNTNQTDDNK